jgi:hypothetical protein
MTFLFLLLASNPTVDAPSPTMPPPCGIACQFPSTSVPPFKDSVPILRPIYLVKLSISSFPVSIENLLVFSAFGHLLKLMEKALYKLNTLLLLLIKIFNLSLFKIITEMTPPPMNMKLPSIVHLLKEQCIY